MGNDFSINENGNIIAIGHSSWSLYIVGVQIRPMVDGLFINIIVLIIIGLIMVVIIINLHEDI